MGKDMQNMMGAVVTTIDVPLGLVKDAAQLAWLGTDSAAGSLGASFPVDKAFVTSSLVTSSLSLLETKSSPLSLFQLQLKPTDLGRLGGSVG